MNKKGKERIQNEIKVLQNQIRELENKLKQTNQFEKLCQILLENGFKIKTWNFVHGDYPYIEIRFNDQQIYSGKLQEIDTIDPKSIFNLNLKESE